MKRRVQVRPETAHAALEAAGLTVAEAARLLGLSRQRLWVQLRDGSSPSSRIIRDLPLLLGSRLPGVSVASLRAALFTSEPKMPTDETRWLDWVTSLSHDNKEEANA